MGKSSSSSKRTKHSRDSSKLGSVKKKKKTKRSKSKKLRRLKDYSDENDSSGSDSSLYSTSEDDYRRKKRRSKVSKKRSRKRYSSSDSDDSEDDDDYRILRKKKRSKSKEEVIGKKNKKKVGSRKRRKRYSSSSSASSESCSIRGNQSDDGSEHDGKRTERLGKVKAVRKRSEDESEADSEPDECWQVEDEVMSEKNSRRLKSIVVVSYSYDSDEKKEDMVHGYDDESDEKKNLHNEGYHEATVSYPSTGADERGHNTVAYSEFGEDTKLEAINASRPDNKLKDDELEAILKKRALENLKRFRGEMQKSGVAIKEVSSTSEGVLQTESENAEESLDHGLMEQKICISAGSKDLETSQKNLRVVNVKESGTVLNLASQQDQQPGDTAKVKVGSGISSCTTKRKLIRPVLGQESLNLASRKEVAACEDAETEGAKGSSTTEKNCRESCLAENIETTKALQEQTEQKKMDEPKDESQYEQKTMTVMKGGEMVKVSYKVYIPKKTSSLGRRQLRR